MSHFTVWLRIDYHDAPEEDKEVLKHPKDFVGGSYWQYSVADILDAENRVLNKQSMLQVDVPVKNGGLKWLLRDIASRLPRFLGENGLRSD